VSGSIYTKYKVIFLVTIPFVAFSVLAQDEALETETNLLQEEAVETEKPLNVPVYPRGTQSSKPLSTIEDLHDQYILLNDGSVISMADWILGSLRKSDLNREMSDFDRRLFLGEVARNMLREGRVIGVQPGVPIKPAPQDDEKYREPKSGQPSSGFGFFTDRTPYLLKPPPAPLIDNGILNGPPIGLFNDVSGTSEPAEINGGKIRLLPDEFETFFDFHRKEWQEHGTYLNMLERHKKKLAKQNK
jgi:hypothetical protein